MVLSLTACAQTSPRLSVLGVADSLGLSVNGNATSSYCILMSPDLHDWEPMAVMYPATGVFPPNGLFELADKEFVFGGQKFYRALAANSCQQSGISATQNLVLSDSLLTFYEGGSASFTVQLASPPTGLVTVKTDRSGGSANIVVVGGTNLFFSPFNWSQPQSVTVYAAQDSDMQDSIAEITVSANQMPARIVHALAVDSGEDEEFVGPFASWMNAKLDFGAKADGATDDTAALQSALSALRPYTNKAVLYLPAGTYRITATLNVVRSAPSESKDIMILGEDPASTTIRWDGPSNGVMVAYGAWYAKMSRLTFDGQAKAKTAIAHVSTFSTHNEFSDMVFTDLTFGIEAGTSDGQGNAETAVKRCKFKHCALAGISLQNPNSLDWFIWHSEFDDCGLGVANIYGAGNYHVYESLFQRSLQADMSIGNTGYFSARNNTSIGSAAFFTATPIPSCGLITLQGNTIINPQGVPIQIGDYGPVVLLDNCIQDYQGQAANIEPSAGFVSVGNTFTVSNAIPSGFSGPAGFRLDDSVACQKIALALPRLPGPPANLNRTIIDLTSPTNAAGLQAAINLAATMSGQRPVVHLPLGTCSIDQTVMIPPGCDVQLVGDGAKTALRWSGSGMGPMLHLAGPARATLRDLIVFGTGNTNQADGILIDNCDQRGGRVYGDQVDVYLSAQVGLFAEGLVNASVALGSFYHEQNPVSVRVKGGGGPPPYQGVGGQVAIFGGASALNGVSYDVNNGGKILARDIWYEATGTNSSPRFMVCTNSGCFTLHGANISPALAKLSAPAVAVTNFTGQLTFLATEFSSSNNLVSVRGAGTNTSVLLLGTQQASEPDFSATNAQMSLQQSFQTTDGVNFNPMPARGPYSADFLRAMLYQTRHGRPPFLTPLPTGVTDVRLDRIFVEGARVGIHLAR